VYNSFGAYMGGVTSQANEAKRKKKRERKSNATNTATAIMTTKRRSPFVYSEKKKEIGKMGRIWGRTRSGKLEHFSTRQGKSFHMRRKAISSTKR